MTPQEWFHRRATDYVAAQVLFHLNQVEVFGELYVNGPLAAGDLAQRLNLNEKILGVLLSYISAVEEITDEENGKFKISKFGKEVFDRYRRDNESERPTVNFFDVRVGCYGPVWSNLSGMMTGEAVYGENLHREGKFAEDALFKLSGNFYPSIKSAIEKVRPQNLIEIGTNSGLIEPLVRDYSHLSIFGLDRNLETINMEKTRLEAESSESVSWIHSDLFDLDKWSVQVPKDSGASLFFSLHFHEFMAAGSEKVVQWLGALSSSFKGSYVLVLEQPLPTLEDKSRFTETLWLYAHSNILIHHLIGNGRILGDEEWISMFTEAGCELSEKKATGYLGYNSYLFRL